MARTYLLAPVALLLTAAVMTRSEERSAPATVTVNAQCQGAGVTVSITPWEARITPNDSVTWTLTGDADAISITPINRGGNPWPFRGNPSGNRANPARSGPPNNRNARGAFPYQISLTCGARTVIIDPEVYIEDE